MNLEGRRIRMVMGLRRAGVTDARALGAMERVERELFVPEAWRAQAYDDRPLPIGHGQTISQPAIVGLMLQALELNAKHRVLEIGVGSGYQTALLARMTRNVYGVERIRALLDEAKARLKAIGVENAFLRWGDGGRGWPEAAPYDRIVAAAAAEDMPAALADQLKVGGVMVLPIGVANGRQTLWRIRRVEDGFKTEELCGVAFVPFLPGAVASQAEGVTAAGGRA